MLIITTYHKFLMNNALFAQATNSHFDNISNNKNRVAIHQYNLIKLMHPLSILTLYNLVECVQGVVCELIVL